MKKKTVWHTDIVINGQGMNVKIEKPTHGCPKIKLLPDVPGPRANIAAARFMGEVKKRSTCSIPGLKKAVAGAVRKTHGRWNRWHHETYD